MSSQIRESQIGPRRVAALEAGDDAAPLALCLHGFPDTPRTWRLLLPDLAAAGYHAVAPWMRGYHPSTAAGAGGHRLDDLAADATTLIEALAPDGTAVVLGHDWGALTASATGILEPERVRAIVSLALPHPAAAAATFMADPDQLRRSWYIWFFQLTGVPEMTIGSDPRGFLERLWREWSPGFEPDAEDLAAVAALAADATVLGEMLAYYRANFTLDGWTERTQAAYSGRLGMPALFAGGVDDGCFGTARLGDSAAYCDAEVRVELLPACGHFLHLERPDAVNPLILDFLTKAAPAT